MEHIYVKIGGEKRRINLTHSFSDFKAQVSNLISSSNFQVLYCEDELLDQASYINVLTQQDYEKGLSVIIRLNRFFKISHFSEEDSLIEEVKSVDSIKQSSIFSLHSNAAYKDIELMQSSVFPNTPRTFFQSGIEESRYGSIKISSNPANNFLFVNESIHISRILKRQKKIQEKREKCSIERLQGFAVVGNQVISFELASNKAKCSFCKDLIMDAVLVCNRCNRVQFCLSCKMHHEHPLFLKEISNSARLKALKAKLLTLGFSDHTEIEQTLLSTNLNYNQTLSALLGY